MNLLAFLKNAEVPLSGTVLADSLDISRVALWKRVEVLRAAGYRITADSRGYRLEDHDLALPWEFPGEEKTVHHFTALSSTMDEALRLGLEGEFQATVVSEVQAQGRGRAGRSWLSPEGSLLATLVVRAPLPLAAIGALGLEALTAMCQTIRELYGLSLETEWPNDLVSDQKKIGGVLVEAWGGADQPRFYTVGVGLNVHSTPTLDRPAASLAGLGVARPDRRALLSGWQNRLRSWCSDPELNPARWSSRLRAGHRVVGESFDGQAWAGAVAGVDRLGSLLLEDRGEQKTLMYGTTRKVKGVSQ